MRFTRRIPRPPRRAAATGLSLALLLTLSAAAGPPWISIEYPANPLDPETRGALVVVRTYHHEAPQVADMRAEVDRQKQRGASQLDESHTPPRRSGRASPTRAGGQWCRRAGWSRPGTVHPR